MGGWKPGWGILIVLCYRSKGAIGGTQSRCLRPRQEMGEDLGRIIKVSEGPLSQD
jgi:hypothetical protein